MSRRTLSLLLMWGPIPLLFVWGALAPTRELRMVGLAVFIALVVLGWYLGRCSGTAKR
jgi:hypothetical protein